ncbi:cyclic nucleotide-binding domain-containing protein [Thermodesulfobacteriota bacterium]
MSISEIIKDMPMFESFSEKEVKMFAEMDHATILYKQGDCITKEGESSTALYLIVKGSVMITRTRDKAKIRIAKLGSGEIFGEMAFFAKKARNSDVTANEDIVTIRMDNDFFEKINPGIKDKIKNYLIELLITRLDTMNESIMRISKLMHM